MLSAIDMALHLAAALEQHGVSYAIGGALAYGIWGVPRGTNDVDVNVFVDDNGLSLVFDALDTMGAHLNRQGARSDAAQEGLFVAHVDGMRLDVFVPSIPFSQEAEALRVRHDVGGRPAYFLSAEALAVFKLLFFRSKDRVDLERLIAVQGNRLNSSFVRTKIVEMMGEDDERVRVWDELLEKFGGR